MFDQKLGTIALPRYMKLVHYHGMEAKDPGQVFLWIGEGSVPSMQMGNEDGY